MSYVDHNTVQIGFENATQIRNISLSKGMKTLREDGWAKAFKGVTSVKEIMRVTEDS